MSEKKNTEIQIEQMMDNNMESLSEIKDIIEIHTLCLKRLVEKQQIIERNLQELTEIVNYNNTKIK